MSKQLKEKQIKIRKEIRRKEQAGRGQKGDDKKEGRKLSVLEHVALG